MERNFLISTSRTHYYATWATLVFLQGSVPIWFWRHMIVESHDTLLWRKMWPYYRSWPTPRQNVGKYTRSYISCVITKPIIKKQGLYTTLPTPNQPWESISMDYLFGLPSIKHGNYCIFVVVDIFSKMAILAAYKKSIIAKDTAKIFFEWVWVHFGILRPLYYIGIVGTWAYFGRVSGHYWTPNSLKSISFHP